MSGIYISGMEMPNKCEFVYICADGKAFKGVIGLRERQQIAHAIQVPDHGRLGDLDRLESDLRNMAKYQSGYRQQGILGCCETIRLASTIIPADKEEA